MKRILIAGALILGGIIILPNIKPFIQEIAGVVISGLPTYESYYPFMKLLADHSYLVVVIAWIAVIGLVMFWPSQEGQEIRR